jgi:CDP-diacylglycerol--glycerol-3-phosphate 3-phosphatidyltransferase
VVLRMARVGITPNQVTLAGFAGNVGAGVLAARGEFLIAGIVTLLASGLDLLDGALARATGKASAFGAVLDSTLDRLSEAAVLAGLAYYFAERGDREQVILCFAAIVGSLLVSYVRARAEYFGLNIREGLFTRPERVIVLGAGLIIDQMRIALWVLAIVAGFTALQRLYVVWERFRRESPAIDREKTA